MKYFCVNIRLDKIASDSIFTDHLPLLKRSSNGVTKSLDDSILDRLCSEILPTIHHKIKWFDLEALSMERVLLTIDYPNLHVLSLFNMERDMAVRFLMELHINVKNFTDCLYLLDGRFRQLHTFYVNVDGFVAPLPAIVSKPELIHLRCFSLTCDSKIYFYEESVVPLLHRMSNIEQLSLYLVIDRSYAPSNSFVDGDDLKKDITCYMPNLNNFVFSIHSVIHNLDFSTHLSSNQDIQHTFKDFKDYQIVSYIDYFPNEKTGRCHIYSYPSQMRYYYKLANSFPGGLFKSVRHVFLYDENPFKFEFFIRFAEACPFLKTLVMENESPQNYEQWKKSNVDNQNLPIIKFPHLTLLDLFCTHNDYIEQFLDHTKTCLSNNIRLFVDYDSLQTVTDNFTRDTTRVNCSKVIELSVNHKLVTFKHLHDYFPRAENIKS
ncbi:hypothetical protein I4U23_013715 [Adineta vaga]|nr:hypothetical protein I4U23_013715 [Adineta vaga]